VIIAEKLMEAGYEVVDCDGDTWRPRLRVGRGATRKRTSVNEKAKTGRKPRRPES